MTPVSSIRRPPFRYAESSSSSLSGLEQVLPSRSPLFKIFQDPADFLDKPLPPTPKQRKSSSVYSTQKEDIIDAYADIGPKDELLPSYVFLLPSTSNLGTVENPEIRLVRPIPQRRAETHAYSEPNLARRRGRNSKPKRSSVHAEQETYQGSVSSQGYASQHHSEQSFRATRAADEQTNLYRAALPSRPSTPPDFQTVHYNVEYNYPQSQLSPRITDVVDHSLVPAPLRSSRIEESDRPSSHFSMTSSDTESIHEGGRDSFRAHARNIFRLPRTSPEEKEKQRIMSVASLKYPHMSLPSAPRQGRFSSIASQRRASIQHGLSNMYDTLTSLSIGPSKLRTTTNAVSTKGSPIPRELRSPAIPITPYQYMGKKAWESPPRSPKPKTPRKSHFSFFSKRRRQMTRHGSNGGPSDSPPPRRTNSERRREELKKKIVVIGAAGQYPDGRVGHWM